MSNLRLSMLPAKYTEEKRAFGMHFLSSHKPKKERANFRFKNCRGASVNLKILSANLVRCYVKAHAVSFGW